MTRLLTISLTLLLGLSLGCASGGASADEPHLTDEIPPTSRLARASHGMTDIQVLESVGPPDKQSRHPTGKNWIPFYFGSDTYRYEFWYRGEGVVIFNRNRWSGVMHVREVLYDPNALK